VAVLRNGFGDEESAFCFANEAVGHSQEGGRRSSVKVQIYDQTYNINSGQDETYARELAAYVDEKMNAVADSTHTVDSVRVAVLAALNIADELFALRAEQRNSAAPLRQRLEKCVELVDQALRQSS
jgi:cell division protein ZapA